MCVFADIVSMYFSRDAELIGLKGCWNRVPIIITRFGEVIMFSPCAFVCLFVSLSRFLSGRFNYEKLVPHKQYFAGTLLGMSSCASYVSRTHDVIDDVTISQSRSNFEMYISPSIFELQCRSKTQNVGNANGYLLVYSISGTIPDTHKFPLDARIHIASHRIACGKMRACASIRIACAKCAHSHRMRT